jgi:adenylate kinase
MVRRRLQESDARKGFILDGFPRTCDQAEILENALSELSDNNLTLISLTADDDVIIKRLSERRKCTACHNIVNLNYLKEKNICPNCGSSNTFVKRKDDEVDVIKNRLKVFHQETKPVLNYYRNRAKLISVDGTQPVEKVTEEILNQLN